MSANSSFQPAQGEFFVRQGVHTEQPPRVPVVVPRYLRHAELQVRLRVHRHPLPQPRLRPRVEGLDRVRGVDRLAHRRGEAEVREQVRHRQVFRQGTVGLGPLPDEVPQPRHRLLPGLGAFADGLEVLRDRGGLQEGLQRRPDGRRGGGEAGGVRREVGRDVSGPQVLADDAQPLHLPVFPQADAEVDIHLERHRVLQRQGKEGIGQKGVDELAGERAVLHDADRKGVQPARQEDTGIRRDDGGRARRGRDAQVSAPVSFVSHPHVRPKATCPLMADEGMV